MKHDKEVNDQLKEMGWKVIRFWSKKVLKYPEYYHQLVMWYLRDNEKDSN